MLLHLLELWNQALAPEEGLLVEVMGEAGLGGEAAVAVMASTVAPSSHLLQLSPHHWKGMSGALS
jgi:hypothetical protein